MKALFGHVMFPNISVSMDIKELPCEDVLGKVEDLIAGFVGFVSACYGKEVSGKKSNIRIMVMVMILTTRVNRETELLQNFCSDNEVIFFSTNEPKKNNS